MLELMVDKQQSLKEFTENHYAQASFFWNYLLKNKEIKVNGKKISADQTVYKGDFVSYFLTKKQEEKAAFYIVYEDENILVADKEDGVNSEAVFAALSREAAGKGEERYFIHRIDRNTKGLLIFAKNSLAESALLTAFKTHTVGKVYHALCFGAPIKDSAVMTAYLKKNAQGALVKIYDQPTNGAEKIVTEYRVLEKFEETTKLEVCLHTGKTHQIRAHFAHIGCPLVGDMKYGITIKNKALNMSRQCLVAKRLHVEAGGILEYLSGKEFVSRFDV